MSNILSVKLKLVYCLLPLQHHYQNKLKLAIIGQSLFGQEVYSNLRKQGHKVVGVFTVPDKDGKADPLGKFPVRSQGFSDMSDTKLSTLLSSCLPSLLLLFLIVGHLESLLPQLVK